MLEVLKLSQSVGRYSAVVNSQLVYTFPQKWLRRFCSYCIFRSTRPISTTFVLTPCPGKISFSIYTPFYVNNSGLFQIFLAKSSFFDFEATFFDFESSDRFDIAYNESIKCLEAFVKDPRSQKISFLLKKVRKF